jgi:hypothetical protein
MDVIQHFLAPGIGLGHSVHVIDELAGHGLLVLERITGFGRAATPKCRRM